MPSSERQGEIEEARLRQQFFRSMRRTAVFPQHASDRNGFENESATTTRKINDSPAGGQVDGSVI